MLPSDINYLANSFKEIAEGKKKKDDDSYLETDMEKRRKNNEKAVEDMKKVKDDTVPRWMREKFELVVAESYYYKRLKVMNEELAERFLDIAAGCIVMGYESPKLIDNIAEALDKEVVGHDFRAALGTVNPHLNENAQTAGRKQARAIAIQISEAPQKPGVYGQVGGLEIGTNPGKNQDVGYRLGRGLVGALRDLGPGLAGQLQGKDNAALQRQRARGQALTRLVTTGKLDNSGSSAAPGASAPTPAAAPKVRRGQGGRALGSTTQRQGGAVNPSTQPAAAPAPTRPAAAPAAAPAAPAAPAKPFVKQTGDKAKDMATWAKANPSLAKPKTAAQKFNPLMQKTFGYQTGNAPDQVAKRAAAPTNTSSAVAAPKAPSLGGAGAAASKALSGTGALKTKLKMDFEPEGELVEYAQGGGGSAPNVPAGVAKFVDELPGNVKKAAKAVKKVVTREEIDPIDESAIGDRARRVVGDQRQGVHGDADAIRRDTDAIRGNLLKLRPYGVKGFPSASKDKKTTQVAHFEPAGNQLDEVLGGQKGDGFIGHPRLGIKNPMAKKQTDTKTAPKNTGLAARLGDRATALEKAMNKEEVSFYDAVIEYLADNHLVDSVSEAHEVMKELTAEEIMYIMDEYTTKHGKKAMDWNRSDDKPKTVAKNPKMKKTSDGGKCSCCGNDPCTC